MRIKLYLLIFMLCTFSMGRAQTELNPLSFGLNQAKTGAEKYEILLRCHQEALKMGYSVSYEGVKEIQLEIPEKFTSIPLGENTDFAGCTIRVKNNRKTVYLYSMKQKTKPISISASAIDNADFNYIKDLKSGNFLIVIRDQNPWVEKRKGFSYGHYRQDVMLVTDGKGSNKPIMPYDNQFSNPKSEYCNVTLSKKRIENLNLIRDDKSSFVTNLLFITYQNNIELKNIKVKTPQNSGFVNDRLIRIEHCTNVVFEDIQIEETYSAQNHSGYAFNLNNIWNYRAKRVIANGNWGVYGNNNLNSVILEHCILNRFDIHCYGRNITSKNCYYYDLYNQFSAAYGEIRYENCRFYQFIPYLTDGTYNAFTEVDVLFKSCRFDFIQQKNKKVVFARISHLDSSPNKRSELKKKSLPNFVFYDCDFHLPDSLNYWYFFDFGKINKLPPLDCRKKIQMHNVIFRGNADLKLCNIVLDETNKFNISFTNVYQLFDDKREIKKLFE